MIGYRISQRDLEKLIDAEKSEWRKQAQDRTEEFRKNGRYEEARSIWSAVKPVYMRLQGDCKCAYCERKLESIPYGKGEQDVEHFRPKSNVRTWRIPQRLKDQGIKAADNPGEGRGYYLLSYHPFNYAASCSPCNRALKKDYFPVARHYDLTGENPHELSREGPYLIYPIGDFDEAPESLLQFHGVSPQPTASRGHRRARALVTIEFFKLDDEAKRKNLVRERAVILVALYPQLQKLNNGAHGAARSEAEEIVDGFTAPNMPHTNCARSFRRLFEKDPIEAKALFDRAVELIRSIS
jgi:hypothetical protein